jgi:hypothetical protein
VLLLWGLHILGRCSTAILRLVAWLKPMLSTNGLRHCWRHPDPHVLLLGFTSSTGVVVALLRLISMARNHASSQTAIGALLLPISDITLLELHPSTGRAASGNSCAWFA